jgi:TRAP-type C4-dicarboxylate transport system substrate-binding protein
MKRWQEEVILLKKEMEWTMEFYCFHRRKWAKLAEEAQQSVEEKWNAKGLCAYAEKQRQMWQKLEDNSRAMSLQS